MPQEANSYGVSTASNPQGVGAVYFEKATDYHSQNLARLDEARKRQFIEDQQKKAATANLFKDLKLDTEGILDTDTEYFHDRIQGLEDFMKEGLKAGVDPSSPSGRQWYSMYQRMADKLQLDMQVSKSQRENIAKANQLAVEKNGDVSATQDRSFKYASIPFEQRNKTADWTKLYVEGVPPLQKVINETWNAAKENIFDVKEDVKEENGIRKTVTKKTLPDSRLWDLSKGVMLNNSVDVDKNFQTLSDADKKFYSDLAAIQSKTSGSPVDAKTAFVYEKFKPFAGQKDEVSDVSFTPERNEMAKDVVEQKSSDALYQTVQGLAELNPEVFQKSIEGTPYLKDNYLYSTKLAGVLFGTRQVPKEVRDIGGKPTIVSTETVPNRIVAVRINRANPNIYEIRTDQDVEDDPNGDVYSMKVSAQQFPEQLWTYNFAGSKDKPDPAKAFNYLKNSAKKYKDVSATGIVTPTQTSTTKNKVSLTKQEPVEGFKSTLSKEGTPVYEKKEAKSTNKIKVILDGKVGEIPSDNWESFKAKYPKAIKQ